MRCHARPAPRRVCNFGVKPRGQKLHEEETEKHLQKLQYMRKTRPRGNSFLFSFYFTYLLTFYFVFAFYFSLFLRLCLSVFFCVLVCLSFFCLSSGEGEKGRNK